MYVYLENLYDETLLQLRNRAQIKVTALRDVSPPMNPFANLIDKVLISLRLANTIHSPKQDLSCSNYRINSDKHSQRYNLLSTLLLLTALFVYSQPSMAEIIEYDVEILIFEDIKAQYIDSEKWPNILNTKELNLFKAGDVNTNENQDKRLINRHVTNSALQDKDTSSNFPTDNTVLNIVDIEQQYLLDEAKKISRSSRYRTLVHRAWRQTGLDKTLAIDVAINSDDNKSSLLTLMRDVETIDGPVVQKKSSIKGSIKVELARYLHLYTDLIYQKPADPPSPFARVELLRTNNYSVKAHRRMRSKVLHYIDHPLVGILVKIVPTDYEAPNSKK